MADIIGIFRMMARDMNQTIASGIVWLIKCIAFSMAAGTYNSVTIGRNVWV